MAYGLAARCGAVVAISMAILAWVDATPVRAEVVLHPENDLGQQGAVGGLQVADMNGDGHDDVITASAFGLEIFLGGGGGFTRSYQSGSPSADGVDTTADFNGDGKLDVAWESTGTLFMRTGNGAGGLNPALWIPPDPGPHMGPDYAVAMTAADFNDDGFDDLAVAYAGTGAGGGLRVFLGQADGTLAAGQRWAFPGTRATAVDWADVNHDGALDLLVGTDTNGLEVALGQATGGVPNGTFADPTGTDSGDVQALVGEAFDNDGLIDDVVYNKGDTLYLSHGSRAGLGAPVPIGRTTNSDPPAQIVAADIDDDGILDVAAASFADFVRVFYGDGLGGFETPQSFATKQYATAERLAVGDFNEDSVDDLIVGDRYNSRVYVMRNSPFALFDSDTFNFGTLTVGAVSAPQTVNIADAGVAPLRVDDVSVEGDGFSLTSTTCAGVLEFAQACSASARFAPRTADSYDGGLVLDSNDPDGPLGVELLGTGVAAPAAPGPQPPSAQPPPSVPPAPAKPASTANATARTDAIAIGRALSRAGLARLASRGSISVLLTAPTAGTESVRVSVGRGPKTAAKLFASGKRSFATAGNGALKLRLSAAGRRLARRVRSLAVTVTSTFAPRSGKAASVSRKLRLIATPR